MHTQRYVLRFSLVFLGLTACLLAFSIKLILIQVFRSSHLAALAERQHNHLVEIEPVRGTIYDRNLRPLAFNVSAYSIFANPKSMSASDKHKAVQQLSALLNLEPHFLQERLNKDKYFVWIKRKLPPELAGEVKKLELNGIGFRKESKRYYPDAALAAHLIGFAGTDNRGLEGLELFYDKQLRGIPGRMQILRDARQTELMVGDIFFPAYDGAQLVLTIDETIQYIAEQALEKAYARHNAKSASIIVMDIRSGEILALANRPTYDLGNPSLGSMESRTNRAISYMYEPGSVFKIVAATAALAEGAFAESDKIFCENGNYRIARNILHDYHPYGVLSFREVFEKSSNIGVTKIAQKLGPEKIYEYARQFRFGMKTGIDLQGEAPGVLKAPRQWSKTSIGAIPIGHEVTVTPLQLVCAISAIANEGRYMRPFVVKYIRDTRGEIIKSFEPEIIAQISDDQTLKRVKDILVGAVEKGTGTKARIKGMSVAGKTGTAQKVAGSSYSQDKFYATFIGFAPAEDPDLAAVVVFDEPHPNHFGGTVAAPVFQEVIENSLKYMESSGQYATRKAARRSL